MILAKRKHATELRAALFMMREKRAPFAHANAHGRIADLPRLIFVNINYGARSFPNLVVNRRYLYISREMRFDNYHSLRENIIRIARLINNI